jgi:hypothetical protein
MCSDFALHAVEAATMRVSRCAICSVLEPGRSALGEEEALVERVVPRAIRNGRFLEELVDD